MPKRVNYTTPLAKRGCQVWYFFFNSVCDNLYLIHITLFTQPALCE